MPAPNKFGAPVKAFPLDGQGERVGFFLRESGDKSQIQVGRDVVELAYREPKDYDEAGPNGTYCSV
jgi:hypothetical protein